MVRLDQAIIGLQVDLEGVTFFDPRQNVAFEVQNVETDGSWQVHVDFRRALADAFFLNCAQYMQCRAFGRPDMSGAVADRARL